MNNETHDITGTIFNPHCDVTNEPLKHFLARQVQPDLNFIFEETDFNGKKVIVLEIEWEYFQEKSWASYSRRKI